MALVLVGKYHAFASDSLSKHVSEFIGYLYQQHTYTADCTIAYDTSVAHPIFDIYFNISSKLNTIK